MSGKESDWYRWNLLKLEIRKLQEKLRDRMTREAEIASKLIFILQARPKMPLSKRQVEVLALLRSHPGYTNKQIAKSLFISERTVKFHISLILHAYEVRTRSELITRCSVDDRQEVTNAEVIPYRVATGDKRRSTST